MLTSTKKKLIAELRTFETPNIHCVTKTEKNEETAEEEVHEYLVNKDKVILDKNTLPLAQKAGWMFFTSLSIAEYRDRVSEEKFKKDTLNLFDINYLDGDGNLLVLHALKSKEEKKENGNDDTTPRKKLILLK